MEQVGKPSSAYYKHIGEAFFIVALLVVGPRMMLENINKIAKEDAHSVNAGRYVLWPHNFEMAASYRRWPRR